MAIALFCGHDFNKTAVIRGPGGSRLAHPRYSFDEFSMDLSQRPVKYRLMMGNPVTKPTDGIKSAVDRTAWLAAARDEGPVDGFSPDGGVVRRTNQTNPERKFELRYDASG